MQILLCKDTGELVHPTPVGVDGWNDNGWLVWWSDPDTGGRCEGRFHPTLVDGEGIVLCVMEADA